MVAARCSSASGGSTRGHAKPTLPGTILNSWGGRGWASFSCTSLGRIKQVTERSAAAIRTARSTAIGSCSGWVIIVTYSLATSLNSEIRSISC